MSEKMLPANFTDEGYARFEADWLAWQIGQPPPLWHDYLPAQDAPCTPDLIRTLFAVDIEFRIKAGLPALLAEHYFEHPRLQQEDACLDAGQQRELIEWEYEQRWKIGQQAARAEYAAAFPQHADAMRNLKPRSRCPKCRQFLELEETDQTFVCPACEKADKLSAEPPKNIGRYRVEKVLGEGGFGLVYLAHGDQLQ